MRRLLYAKKLIQIIEYSHRNIYQLVKKNIN